MASNEFFVAKMVEFLIIAVKTHNESLQVLNSDIVFIFKRSQNSCIYAYEIVALGKF